MWPRRKILLVAPSTEPDLVAIQALLEGCNLAFSRVEPAEAGEGTGNQWFDQPFTCWSEEPDPVTELVFWPNVTKGDVWRKKANICGLTERSVQSFLHNIWSDETLLRAADPAVIFEGRPLLWHILNQAGFEPSLLWPKADGQWLCEQKQGVKWILPQSGLLENSGDFTQGRQLEQGEATTWVVRSHEIDFYRAQDVRQFIGRMPRWPEPMEEQAACQDIAFSVNLGVSWFDIEATLQAILETTKTYNMRWNRDDIGWNAGANREELSPAPSEHVEDRRAG